VAAPRLWSRDCEHKLIVIKFKLSMNFIRVKQSEYDITYRAPADSIDFEVNTKYLPKIRLVLRSKYK